jgi:hypothetical protein
MSYYRGDYYAGGFWGTLGGIAKGIGGMAAGFIPGIGGKISTAISRIPTGGAKSGAVASAAGAGMAMVKAGAAGIRTGIMKHPVLSAAGAAGAAGLGAGVIGSRSLMHPAVADALAGGMPSRGFHISKRTGGVVRNRRMNPCNGHALARATRRLHAFAKRYRKVVGFVAPHKPKGRMYFKKRKSKK